MTPMDNDLTCHAAGCIEPAIELSSVPTAISRTVDDPLYEEPTNHPLCSEHAELAKQKAAAPYLIQLIDQFKSVDGDS